MSTPASAYSQDAPNSGMGTRKADSTIRGRTGLAPAGSHQLAWRVYRDNGISVTDVMIDGRWMLRQGKLLTIDEKHLYARARALREEMEDHLREQFRQTTEIEPALRQQYLKAAEATWSELSGA
jgi:hypothetical protein